MESILGFGYSFAAFLFLLTVLVFVHEMGHFLLARRHGVRVEVFSIGFGPEIFGWMDRHGTRWKFSWIPLGGYVKMFGDADVTSVGEIDTDTMTEAERAQSFHGKRLGQRAAIVFAGPAINYFFAVLIWALLFVTVGETFTPAEISAVHPDSAAARAGLKVGDVFVRIDGAAVERFEDVQQIIRMNPGTPIEIVVRRDGREVTVTADPVVSEFTDSFGNVHRVGLLGVSHFLEPVIGAIAPGGAADRAGFRAGDRVLEIDGAPIVRFGEIRVAARDAPGKKLDFLVERDGARLTLVATLDAREIGAGEGESRTVGVLGAGPQSGQRQRLGPLAAVGRAFGETYAVTRATFKAIGQMFAGTRTTDELGGPIKIAQMSGQMAQGGGYSFFWFMAFISLNLGLINLLPVPMLDGGHLLYYAIEAVRGKPLGQRAQEYGFRIGLALVLTLMVFVTWNDLVNLRVFDFVKNLIS